MPAPPAHWRQRTGQHRGPPAAARALATPWRCSARSSPRTIASRRPPGAEALLTALLNDLTTLPDRMMCGYAMMRGYAIGLGAATQKLTLMAGEVIAGPPSELSRALLMGAGWVINLAVAEWAIRRRPAHPARTAAAGVAHLR